MFVKSFGLCFGIVVAANIIFASYYVPEVEASTKHELLAPYSVTEVMQDVNEARSKSGLATLAVSPKLQAAAQAKVDDMVVQNYFLHTNPQGLPFWNFIQESGYKFFHAGENLAGSYSSVDSLVEAWLDSPGHRANIMNSDYTETGIGIAYSNFRGNTGWYVVQMFGSPLPDGVEVIAYTQQ